jgi:hypothetical protein
MEVVCFVGEPDYESEVRGSNPFGRAIKTVTYENHAVLKLDLKRQLKRCFPSFVSACAGENHPDFFAKAPLAVLP